MISLAFLHLSGYKPAGGTMPVRTFELFHGAVLTKLVRQGRRTSLCLIETKRSDSWATYLINDAFNLVIKHSTNLKHPKREPDAATWQFTFGPDQMKQFRTAGTRAALVCGSLDPDSREMEVCLLEHHELAQLLFLDGTWPQSVIVKRLSGRCLRVTRTRSGGELKIARDRLEKWPVPGS